MKKIVLMLALMPFVVLAQKKAVTSKATPQKVAVKNNFKTGLDSFSYAIATRIALNLEANHIDTLNYNSFIDGLKDVFKKNKLKFDDNVITNTINTRIQQQSSKKASKEKQEGIKFLEANKKRQGVITTKSGLQYEVITMGTGVKPSIHDTVVCNYAGTLINGFEFDNSYKRGEPIKFLVSGVIKGWTEALQLMPKGSKWKLFIPSDLGYGDNGAGQDIPGGATLIFEVELVDVRSKQ